MTTLGNLTAGGWPTVTFGKVDPALYSIITGLPAPFDLDAVVASVLPGLTAAGVALAGNAHTVRAPILAWIEQDDDAHEPCSLTACRHPLHPGPCKGWKGTLHSVAPGTYKQIEEERVRKANERRVKRIADLKSQGKPIPRRLLAEIKPKPAPTHPANGATAVPLGQVNQKADLAGGQAHTAGQAVSKAAGVQVKTAPLPLGPKQKKPTVAGRGPAFVITQPKVTDTYKLDKADKITPQEWNALTDADKTTIRNELTAIKARGFGPQQAKADALLAKLPAPGAANGLAPGTPGTVTTPSGKVYQKVSVTPGKVSLGQAVKTPAAPAAAKGAPGAPSNPTQAAPAPSPATPSAPKVLSPEAQQARAVAGRGVPKATLAKTHLDTYGKLTKADFDQLDGPTQKTIRDDLANAKGKFLDPKKQQQAADLLDRFGAKHPAPATPAAPSGSTAMTPTNVAALIRKNGSADLILGGKKVTTGFSGKGHEGELVMAPGGHYVVTTKDGTKHNLAKGQLVQVAASSPGGTAAHPKGYSDPMAQAVKAVSGASTDDVLKSVGTLSPASVDQLDAGDRKQLLGRLVWIATHPKATAEQKAKAAAYGRIINGGTYVPASKKFDHTPSVGELHREEQQGGHAAAFGAVVAARDAKMDRADRIKALDALTKAQFDAVDPGEQRQIVDALQGMHYTPGSAANNYSSSLDPSVAAAIERYTGKHPAMHRLEQAEDEFRAGKIDGDKVYAEFLRARVQANPPVSKAVRDAVDARGHKVAVDNPTLPSYVRVEMAGDRQYGNPAYGAIGLAGMKHNWEPAPRFSSTDMHSLFRVTDADLAAVDPIHAQAVRDLQVHALRTGLRGQPGVPSGSPWSTATRDSAINEFLGADNRLGQIPPDRLARFNALPSGVQDDIRRHLRERIASQSRSNAKVVTWTTLRELEGKPPLARNVKDALDAVGQSSASGKLDTFGALTSADFRDLPDFARQAIREDLAVLQLRAERNGGAALFDATTKGRDMPALLAARLDGKPSPYMRASQVDAADIAQFGTKIYAPNERVIRYGGMSSGSFGQMNPGDQQRVTDDLTKIQNDTSLPLTTRYDAAMVKDVFHPSNPSATFSAAQLDAMEKADPNQLAGYPDLDAIASFGALSKSEYDSLAPVYREAIDARVLKLQLSSPSAAQLLAAKFHPAPVAANPSGSTPTTVQANIPPHVQTALDVLYGVDPKSHTMARQLSAYGALRGSDFGALNSQEQSQLLGDLSFIATTAKGPSSDKAKKLIDRFTPPGTPAGQVPNQPVIPPANAVPGQIRFATPQVGTLVQAKDKGQGGDGWLTTPGGKRVWGKYGAAGLLLQHVDPQTGEKRYLMVQRGPGISDPGKWQFPGGAIDSKETFHQGGTREVIEELGFDADALKTAQVHGEHHSSIPGSTWKYVSIAAQVDKMLKPDLSTHHARMETADAKWMTEAEIKALDTSGKLLAPLAGGKLEQNVLSLFPQTTGAKLGQAPRPGPVTKRLGRLTMPAGGRQSPASFNAWPHAHKPSTGKNLVPDKAAIDTMRQKIKQDRALYDGKTADGRLAAIGAMQGFDAMPTVESKSEIDRLLATGDYIEAWRGVSGAGGGWSARGRGGHGGKTAADINEEMRTGPAYYGKGIFGNGYYLATQKSVASQYADGTKGSIMRVLIPKSALTQTYDKVEKEAQANSSRISKAKGSSGYELSTFWDPGRWGAAKGIDGIEINPHHRAHGGGGASHVASHGKPAYNWLNRSVLIIQKEPG